MSKFFTQELGPRMGQVNADLLHSVNNFRMNPRGRLGSRRERACFGGIGEGIEPRCCHLRTPRVVDTGKEDGFHLSRIVRFRPVWETSSACDYRIHKLRA